jgi:CubicO group peptidase (beta-lactamase class C family)
MRRRLGSLALLAVGLVSAPTQAQDRADGSVAPRRGLSTRAELEAFMDGVTIANLRDKHVVGATVSVVKDGELFFAKGYGFADLDKRAPVDAEKTLFRIGSISKLFTWTAVMQLVEEGKLSLDADVNGYIDFEIPKTFPEPITLRHVMTHTAGFEDDGRDLFTDDPSRIVPLGKWLATHIPGRVRPPGKFSSYSNYASALAGYIVERVAGKPWADCIEERVLAPLGMDHTSLRQPLPASLAPEMSQGYTFDEGHFTPGKWEIITGATPAGSVSSSATDMAKFMLAHLMHGAYHGHRILSEATTEQMHARAFTHDERVNGLALGFYEKSSHGLRIIGHGGNTRLFHSDLALIPSENVGIFVSYNTTTGKELSMTPFLTEFLDHYYPTPPIPVTTSDDGRAEMEHIAGTYAMMRRSYTTFQKIDVLDSAIEIEVIHPASSASSSDSTRPTNIGSLLLQSSLGTFELVRIGPMLYRNANGEELFAFRGELGAPAEYGFIGFAPPMPMERLPWYESPTLHGWLLAIAILVFIGIVFAAALRAYRKWRNRSLPFDPLPGRRWMLCVALCNLAFVIALAMLATEPTKLVTSPMTELKIVLALPVIACALTIGALIAAVRQWRTKAGTFAARLRYSAAIAVALAFAWSLDVWNLFGWHV